VRLRWLTGVPQISWSLAGSEAWVRTSTGRVRPFIDGGKIAAIILIFFFFVFQFFLLLLMRIIEQRTKKLIF